LGLSQEILSRNYTDSKIILYLFPDAFELNSHDFKKYYVKKHWNLLIKGNSENFKTINLYILNYCKNVKFSIIKRESDYKTFTHIGAGYGYLLKWSAWWKK